MEPVSIQELAAACSAEVFGAPQAMICGVETDSRKVTPGCLFAAVKGARTDGHAYLAQALERGAAAVLACERESVETFVREHPGKGCLLLVPPQAPGELSAAMTGTEYALGKMAAHYRRRYAIPAVAVTGSVGKTSTKDLTAAVLSGKYRTLKTMGNYNNPLGAPLTVFRLSGEDQAAVFEIGMEYKGVIRHLCEVTRPNAGIITNIGTAHLENLGSREGILQAKLEMAGFLKKEDPLFLCGDDELLYAQKGKLTPHTEYFGKSPACEARLITASLSDRGTVDTVMSYRGEEYRFSLRTLGLHMAVNVLPAVMTGVYFGLTRDQILEGLTRYEPSPHRLEPVRTSSFLIIDDTYNASPVSMLSALDTLCSLPVRGRRLAVLGDMLELGASSQQGHRQTGEHAARMYEQGKLDALICCGPLSREMAESAHKVSQELPVSWFESTCDLNAHLESLVSRSDTILVKASHAMEFSSVVEKLERIS